MSLFHWNWYFSFDPKQWNPIPIKHPLRKWCQNHRLHKLSPHLTLAPIAGFQLNCWMKANCARPDQSEKWQKCFIVVQCHQYSWDFQLDQLRKSKIFRYRWEYKRNLISLDLLDSQSDHNFLKKASTCMDNKWL